MALKRQFDLHINTSARTNPLMLGAADPTQLDRLDLIQDDKFELRIYFNESSGNAVNPLTNLQLDAGSLVFFSGKETATLKTGSPLFLASAFTEAGGSGNPYYYKATLNLRTVDLTDWFDGTTANYVDLTVDIEVENADDSERITYQFAARIHRQAYDSAEDTPAVLDDPSVAWMPRVPFTAYTGGAVGALDAEITQDRIVINSMAWTVVAGVPHLWIFEACTDAEDVAGGVIRPDDYDGTTNPNAWIKKL